MWSAFAVDKLDITPADLWSFTDQIGKLYENFVRKRALVKYQFQSEVIEVLLYLVTHS